VAETFADYAFPPDGIAFYRKNSAVSQRPCEPGRIRTDSHASRTATLGSVLPGIWSERRERFVLSSKADATTNSNHSILKR
jgi:hypothetical protein